MATAEHETECRALLQRAHSGYLWPTEICHVTTGIALTQAQPLLPLAMTREAALPPAFPCAHPGLGGSRISHRPPWADPGLFYSPAWVDPMDC